MQATLYTRPECSLCDDAKELLHSVAGELGVAWEELSILDSAAHFERFRYRVPVLCVDGREVLELRFDAAAVRAALRPSGG